MTQYWRGLHDALQAEQPVIVGLAVIYQRDEEMPDVPSISLGLPYLERGGGGAVDCLRLIVVSVAHTLYDLGISRLCIHPSRVDPPLPASGVGGGGRRRHWEACKWP